MSNAIPYLSVSKWILRFCLLNFLFTIGLPVYAEIYKIPLKDDAGWEILKYSKIKPNKVKFLDDKLIIDVDNSSSPLVYPFSKPLLAEEVLFSSKIEGKIDLGTKQQGEKGADDFLLRIGLVYLGTKTLGFFKRQIAADWVIHLFQLAPEGAGIEKIRFYNIFSDKRLYGKKREHPSSDLIEENFVFENAKNGEVTGQIKTDTKSKVLALWISSDGDDTKSKFQTIISKLEIKTK